MKIKLFTEDFNAEDLIDYNNKECFNSKFPDSKIEDTIFYPDQDPNVPTVINKSLHLNDSRETIISKFKNRGYLVTRYELDLITGCKNIAEYFCNNLKEVKQLISK